MKDSYKRITYITDYINAYETKIKIANSNGLFDNAKLFELFALEVCKLWFEQDFKNLNEETTNYPYVDLISNDRKIYVQVSTQKDVPSKIKRTLEKIKNSESKKASDIESVYFIVLNNDSIDNVVDYSGNQKIGNVEFIKDKHLITTQDIVKHSIKNLDFQIALYDLLQKEDCKIRDISNKLFSELNNSREIGLKNIDCLINNEYEIDRSEIIEKIKNSKKRFISVRGEAGSGKSVICKKSVETEPHLLFARAERFLEENDINNIWHIDLKDMLIYLNNKPIVFYIDSLEFIADAPKSKIDLLQALYELVKEYPNARIITSCRSSDETAFLKIDSKYEIERFIVGNLSLIELNLIAQKYPIINDIKNDCSYVDLIRSPFYINLIVKHITDAKSISDENKLRDNIWENVICLKEKCSEYRISFDNVVKEIKQMVFDRAKMFLLGVNKDNINHDVLKALISEGVVIENGNTVRLKYDIFEDICFEKEIDNEFDLCKGDYNKFFENIESFGRCCYRRYQIWISNKLLSKKYRDKFLYELIFKNSSSQKWNNQTIIGIVKSKFSAPFFEEYKDNLIYNNLLEKFVDIINLYGFEAKVLYHRLFLTPKGRGRESVIKVLCDKELYKTSTIDKKSIIKLCSDYAKSESFNNEIAILSCKILEYYIDDYLNNDDNTYYGIYKSINELLIPIYLMSEFSKQWIISFWGCRKADLLCDSQSKRRMSEEIIEHTLKNAPNSLAKFLPKQLCNLAQLFWTVDLNDSHLFYGSRYDSVIYQYGLNKHADSYEHSLDSLIAYNFFPNMVDQNFWLAFDFAIEFINNAVLNYTNDEETQVKEIELYFATEDVKRKYYASYEMWLAGSQQCSFPTLLADMVYTIKRKIINIIKSCKISNFDFNKFVNNIKSAIYEKSNNVALFSIIEDIGILFEKDIPGFALDLATSMDIIYWDIHRYSTLNPTEEIVMRKRNIFSAMGVPYIKDRYEDNSKMDFMLQQYVLHMQLNSTTREYCYKILDYLYLLYPNDNINANEHLQIQKMDIRNATIEPVDENTVSISPAITGAAKDIVLHNEEHNKAKMNIKATFEDFFNNFDPNNYELEDVIDCIDKVENEIDSKETFSFYQEYFLLLIIYALNKEELSSEKRNEFCDFWIDGINKILNNGSFSFKSQLIVVLCRQIISNASVNIKNKIKKLIIDIITFDGTNGIILDLKNSTREYLKTDSNLSKIVFNTIVMLAKDEMEHQIFNYATANSFDDDITFVLNRTPKLSGVDYGITRQGKECYTSRGEEIINQYLYDEKPLDMKNITLNQLDIDILSNVAYCGIDVKDEIMSFIMHEIFKCLLDVWNNKNYNDFRSESIDYMTSFEISDYLGRELLVNTDEVIDIMFNNIDFTNFSDDAVEFYINVFHILLATYIDAYNNYNGRKLCENILLKLEEKINLLVLNVSVKKQLYRSLILSITGYEGDWNKVKTKYSYEDIQFLNAMFSKYGKYNFKCFMSTVCKMKFKELLPNILPSIATTLSEFSKKEYFKESDLYASKSILEYLIIYIFLNYNDEIKQDEELTKSYESILETLISFNFENAAVLLDEFRIF